MVSDLFVKTNCICTIHVVAAGILIDLFSLHSLDDAEYVKAMAAGGGNLEHLNIVLHGPPGSGKSSLKRAVLGEDPLPQVEQNSTGIMENAVRAVSMDRTKNFKVIKNRDLLDLLAEAMKHCAQIKKVVREQMSTAVSDTCVVQLPKLSLPKTISPWFVFMTLVVLQIPQLPSSHQIPDICCTISLCYPVNNQRKAQECQAHHQIYSILAWYHLIDSGGQSQYQGHISFPVQQQLFLPTPGDAFN